MAMKFNELSEELQAQALLSTRSYLMRNFSQEDRNRMTQNLSEIVKKHGYTAQYIRWSFNINNDTGRLAFYGEVVDFPAVMKRTLSKQEYRMAKWLRDILQIRLTIVDNSSSTRNALSMECCVNIQNQHNLNHFHDMRMIVEKLKRVVRDDARHVANALFTQGLNMVKEMFSEENIRRAIDTFNFDFKEDGTIIAPATRPDFSVLHRG